jgi:hypothetical protein
MLRQNKRKNNYINNEFNILSYTAVIVVAIIIIIIIIDLDAVVRSMRHFYNMSAMFGQGIGSSTSFTWFYFIFVLLP